MQSIQCPRCNQQPGAKCTAPNGAIAADTHKQRLDAYRSSISTLEFHRRHSLVRP